MVQEKSAFAIVLPCPDEPLLFYGVGVVDVIKRMEAGNCALRRTARYVDVKKAPGKDFDTYPNIPCTIVCPRCIGVKTAQLHAEKRKMLGSTGFMDLAVMRATCRWVDQSIEARGYNAFPW